MTELQLNPPTILCGPQLPGLDECWVMDWYSTPRDGQTRVGAMVHRAKYARMGPAASQLGSDLGSWCVALREMRNWPRDLVIVPVPSSSGLVNELARRVSMATRRPVQFPLVASSSLRLKFQRRALVVRSVTRVFGSVWPPAGSRWSVHMGRTLRSLLVRPWAGTRSSTRSLT